MRHNQNRRSRGRNNRKGPNPLTRSFESNGPDVKVRGTAAHIADKYTSLARDAQAAGDIVAVESYLQHAEHYNRIVMAAQAQFQQSQPQFRDGPDEGYDDDRQMNGRDRFEYNGEGRGDEGGGGEDRYEGNEESDDRGYRPRPQQQHRYEDRGDRRDDRRGPPRDRYQYRDRNERPEQQQDDRPQFSNVAPSADVREAAPQPEQPVQPVQAAPVEVEADERPSPPRRRRGRPRAEGAGEARDAGEGGDVTPDGAAALAAFRD